MKRKLFYTFLIILLSFIFVFAFQYFNRKPQSNGFNRKIEKYQIQIEKSFQLPHPYFYFAGLSKTELFFKNLHNTSKLFVLDSALFSSKEVDLKLDQNFIKENNKVTIGINDSSVYVVYSKSGKLAILLKENNKRYNFKSPGINMSHARLISKQSIVGKNADRNVSGLKRRLIKINYLNGKIENKYELEKQVDGFFCTDGMLYFDNKSSKIFYMYFYRGEVLCLDTNLVLQFKSKTVDTVTKAVINIAKFKANNTQAQTTITQSTPPQVVNRNFIINDDFIYIMSALKADNEDIANFRNSQIIDVYSLNNVKYLYSFYIPKYKGKKLREFRISEGFIFATFDDYLVKYKFSRNIEKG